MRRFDEKKNGERAQRGGCAFEAWLGIHEDAVEDDTATNLTDLLANVLHYAHSEGLDPLPILRMAEHHYTEEA